MTPKSFKSALGSLRHNFEGCVSTIRGLVAFLLDGLNEDLNKVKDKPYIQLDEKDGQDERNLQTCHGMRIFSVTRAYSEAFHGQFKSVVMSITDLPAFAPKV